MVVDGAAAAAGADAEDNDNADADGGDDDADGAPFGALLLRRKGGTAAARRGPASAPVAASADAAAAWEAQVPPAPPGWTRLEVPRKTVEGSDVYYRLTAPGDEGDGTLLRSMPEVAKWLNRNREAHPGLSIDDFSFVKSALYGGKPPAAGRKPGCAAGRGRGCGCACGGIGSVRALTRCAALRCVAE